MSRQPRKWTKEKVEDLIRLYQDNSTKDIAYLLGFTAGAINNKAHLLGIKKSIEFIRIFLKGGERTRFAKGNIPWNVGLKGVNNPPKHTLFKSGHKPKNHKPVGSLRKSRDGYLEIKVAEGLKQWKPLHHKTWFDHHGEYPKKGFVLIFKDGNKDNFEINNLDLISKADIIALNTINRFPAELRELIFLSSKLKRKLNEQSNNN